MPISDISTPAHPPSPAAMRAALGMFATGVTIVTTCAADGTPIGLTANSFNSVSLSPPLVLWSLSATSASLATFLQASHYAIHVLDARQQALAQRFASKAAHRFEGLEWRRGLGGVPVLSACAAVFECNNRSRYPEGDHVILVGEVLACQHDAASSPLLYHGGKFYTEHAL